jgi:hypothetical protein
MAVKRIIETINGKRYKGKNIGTIVLSKDPFPSIANSVPP